MSIVRAHRRAPQHERVYAMPDDLGWDSFDRRHFMVTAIGASAVLAASTDPASAQAATTSRGTVYTGDRGFLGINP